MADRAREKGRTERYLPKAAWASRSKEEGKATDDKKKAAGDKPVGHQVKNTKAAAEARKRATSYRSKS